MGAEHIKITRQGKKGAFELRTHVNKIGRNGARGEFVKTVSGSSKTSKSVISQTFERYGAALERLKDR